MNCISFIMFFLHSIQNQQYNPQLHSLEKQALQIKDQYVKTVAELNTEITTLQEELKGNRNELKISKIQVTELRKTLEEMRNQMIRQVRVSRILVFGFTTCFWTILLELRVAF